jgi:transposase
MYLGVDIHKAFCQTTVMDEHGTIVEQEKVPTDPEHLEAFFRRYSGSRAVIESNTVWEFVYEKLQQLGIDVTLANPSQVKAIAQARVKTDTVDSATLAHLLRGNLVPAVWVGPPELRELRKDVRARRGLRGMSTMLKNQLYSELIRLGIPVLRHFLSVNAEIIQAPSPIV